MLGGICANSDADLSFDKVNFTVIGSDDAVKSALTVISELRFFVQSPHQIRVKIELANEHKEFVSGKKNGKINKIMGQSMSSPLSRPSGCVLTCSQAMCKSFSMVSTSTTSTLISWQPATSP